MQLNCVVMRGLNDDEICDFVELTKDKEIDVRFIEYMPFEGNKWNNRKMVPYHEMLENIRERYDLHRVADAQNDTSKALQPKINALMNLNEFGISSCRPTKFLVTVEKLVSLRRCRNISVVHVTA